MQMKLQTFLSGLAGVAAGLALGLFLFSGGGDQPGGAAENSRQMEQLHADLQAIASLLQVDGSVPAAMSDSAARLSTPAPGLERKDLEEFRADLGEALSSLQIAINEFRKANAILATWNQNPSTLESPLRDEMPKPMDSQAVARVRETLEMDETETPPDFFGLSPAQVYQRLGTPNFVNTGNGRVRWYYNDPHSSEGLIVSFIDGYVVWLLRHEESE